MGLGSGGLITGGLGFFARTIARFTDWSRKYIWKKKGRNQLINTKITGNIKIPFNVKHIIFGNFNSPYQKIYSILGNNKITTKESLNVKGNYKKQLLYETKTTGKKNFFKIIYELLLDDD